MSARSPVGRTIVGRPRRSRTVGSGETHIIDNPASRYHNRNGPIHDNHNGSFIPKVPRIPDKFLKRERRGFGRAQNLLRDTEHGDEGEGEIKIDLKSIPAPYTRYLPNCSFGKPQAVQVLSNAMMQAYLAMRGNCLGGQDGVDPLFEWIQRREELARVYKPTIHGERDVSKMLKLIDKALLSSHARGDSPREARFEVYRPDFEHIKPPQDMDMSANEFDACCADFEWKDDSDDDEADVPSGRISPCTFLEWSKDCVRWNANENENKKDTTSYIRVRPDTHKPSTAPKRHEHPPSESTIAQWDVNTGEELTPAYFVPTSPSIIYTPPGVEFTGFRDANFHVQYRRMAPLVDRELRSKIYGAREGPPYLPDSEKAGFSISEVNSATAIIPELQNRAGPELEAAFQSQWAAIAQAEAAEKALYKEAERQRAVIEQLQLDRRHLNEFLPALHVHRELRDREQREREAKLRQMQEQEEKERERKEREREMEMGKSRRGEVIRAYVAEHALDIQSRLDMACFRLNRTRAGVCQNLAHIAGLENEVRQLCEQAGVRDPAHAYAVLMGVKSDEGGDGYKSGGMGGHGVDVHAGGNGNGYAPNGYDYGYGYAGAGTGVGAGGPMGPWSESSLGRAEEEYARFLADMQMKDARGRASSKEWEVRHDDDGSSDSGVSGLEGRDGYRSHYSIKPPPGLGYHA